MKYFLLATAASLAGATECNVEFEFIYVQDNTQGMGYLSDGIKPHLKNMLYDFKETYPGSKFALSMFSDKPIPFSGYGNYGGYGNGYPFDFCFRALQSMTDNVQQYYKSYLNIWPMGGDDLQENIFGGIVDSLKAPEIGWTNRDMNAETGSKVVRVMVVGTDAIPHTPGDAQKNIAAWNDLWGTPDMPVTSLMYGECYLGGPTWNRITELMTKYRADPASLSDADMQELESLESVCGPYPWADMTTNSGQYNPEQCITADYPSVDHAMAAVTEAGVIPFYILMEPEIPSMAWIKSWGGCPTATTEASCVKEFYQTMFEAHGIEGYFHSIEGRGDMNGAGMDALAFIKSALGEVKEKYCSTTPEPEPTVPTLPATLEPTVPTLPATLEPTVPTMPTTLEPTVPTSPATLEPTVPTSPATLEPTVPTSPATLEATSPATLEPTVPTSPATLEPTVSTSPATLEPTVPTSPATLEPTVSTSPATLEPTVPTSPATLEPTVPTSPATLEPTVPTLPATTVASATTPSTATATSGGCNCDLIRASNIAKIKELGLKEKIVAKYGSLEEAAKEAIRLGMGGKQCAVAARI